MLWRVKTTKIAPFPQASPLENCKKNSTRRGNLLAMVQKSGPGPNWSAPLHRLGRRTAMKANLTGKPASFVHWPLVPPKWACITAQPITVERHTWRDRFGARWRRCADAGWGWRRRVGAWHNGSNDFRETKAMPMSAQKVAQQTRLPASFPSEG